MADHQPAVRTQYRQVIGDVLGVGRADTDIDQGDAIPIGGLQVVGGHLVLVPDHAVQHRLHFPFGHATLDHHVARQHHAAEPRVAEQHVQSVADELIDVAVIVGQQDPGLYMAPVAAGVMHQPAQGEIRTRGVEQRQRQRVGPLPVDQAVGDTISGGGQVGAGKHPRQLGSGHARAGQLIALLHHVGIGNGLLADADFQPHVEFAGQRAQLLQQIAAKGLGMGNGRAVGARHLDLGPGAHAGRRRIAAGPGQAQFGIAEQPQLFCRRPGAVPQILFQGTAQGAYRLIVQGGQLVDGVFGGLYNDELFGTWMHGFLSSVSLSGRG